MEYSPAQMNCAHQDEGWCSDCIATLMAERDAIAELARVRGAYWSQAEVDMIELRQRNTDLEDLVRRLVTEFADYGIPREAESERATLAEARKLVGPKEGLSA